MGVEVEIGQTPKSDVEPGQQPENRVVQVAEAGRAIRPGMVGAAPHVMRDAALERQAAREQRAADRGHRTRVDVRVKTVSFDAEPEAPGLVVGNPPVALGAPEAGEIRAVVKAQHIGRPGRLRPGDPPVIVEPAERAREREGGGGTRDRERVRRLLGRPREDRIVDEDRVPLAHQGDRKNGFDRRSSPIVDGGPVSAHERDVVAERKQLRRDRPEQHVGVAIGEIGPPHRTAEQRVADLGEARLPFDEDDMPRRVSRDMQDVEPVRSDRDDIAFDEEARGRDPTHARQAKARRVLLQHGEQERVGLPGPLDRRRPRQHVLQLGGSSGMIDMTMGQQDATDLEPARPQPAGHERRVAGRPGRSRRPPSSPRPTEACSSAPAG